ncbi:attacin-A-like [Musca autumnalis]|uniref:attacin-A-like n=1 Tax=Musca autumnalis TaxID=221902 RepID=UPI003CF0B0A5
MILNTVGVTIIVATLSMVQAQFGGSLSSNSRGGQDYFASLGRQFGDNNRNVGGGVFASGNTLGGPLTRGGFLSANSNGLGVGISQSKTDNFGSTFAQNAHANLFRNDKHQLDAVAFHSRTNLDNGYNFNKVGGGLDYKNVQGHGASVTVSRIPQLNMNTVDVTGKLNLLKSQDKSTSLDLTAGVSKNIGGPMDGQIDKHVNLGLTKTF